MNHGNEQSVCEVYGLELLKVIHNKMGPTISFNLKRPDGSWFGYREVEKLATLSGIQLRTGCFCNPGACAKYLGLTHSDLLSNIEAGHMCWDDNDVLNGKPTGAVRVSFGYMSTFEDALKLLHFIKSNFMSLPSGSYLRTRSIPPPTRGLLHDREWLLKSMSGEILTQKKVPDMCYITTLIDLNLRILFVESPRCIDKIKIGLDSDSYDTGMDEMDIHTRRYEVQSYKHQVNAWFTKAVGRPCTLLRSFGSQSYASSYRNMTPGMCRDWNTRLNFVNEAQLLLISDESLADLNTRLGTNVEKGSSAQSTRVTAMRFRPNLVVAGGTPYEEDGWRSLKVGTEYFKSLGGCNRCQMININVEGEKVQRLSEPLATLAAYRRVKGKILFGILLQYEISSRKTDAWLRVGQEIIVDAD